MTTLEFALVAGTLLIALVATFEISRFIATHAALRVAVTEVSRRALIDVNMNNTTAKTFALGQAPLLNAARLTMTFNRDTAVTPPTVAVTATYNFTFVSPVFGATNRTLNAAITTPVQTPL